MKTVIIGTTIIMLINNVLLVDFATTAAVTEVNCPKNLTINEVSDDPVEFLELFDGGSGQTRLDSLVLVHWSPSGQIYRVMQLEGMTNENGYFLIGDSDSADFLTFGYTTRIPVNQKFDRCCFGPSDVYSIHCDYLPTDISQARIQLIDAIAYNLNVQTPIVKALFTPLYHSSKVPETVSASRCGCCHATDLQCLIESSEITPGAENSCPGRMPDCPPLESWCISRQNGANIWDPRIQTCYAYYGIEASWEDAMKICANDAPQFTDGSLVHIESTSVVQRLNRRNPSGLFWIGMKLAPDGDPALFESWRWMFSASSSSAAAPTWNPETEMKMDLNLAENNGECMSMTRDAWIAFGCASKQKFICQFRAKSS